MIGMSRPVDPRYADHPLKILRQITELSQPAFAEITGISLDTIRAIEIGRRNQGKLSQDMVELIALSIGAGWNQEKGQWDFLYPSYGQGERIPYAKEHFQTFSEELLQEATERSIAIYHLVFKFLSFCEAIPSVQFNGWFWRLERLFEGWQKEVSWQATGFELDPHWDRKTARILGYRKMFPKLLQGEEKKFDELIKSARREQLKHILRVEANFDEPIEKAATTKIKPKPKKRRSLSKRPSADGSQNI